jgi:hypothetical protein
MDPRSCVFGGSCMARRRDWAQVAEGWERSGKTQRAFALQRGVSLTTLQSWIYRRRRERPPSRLVEVRVAPVPATSSSAEIVLPHGVTVRIDVGTEPAWTSALVKALLA